MRAAKKSAWIDGMAAVSEKALEKVEKAKAAALSRLRRVQERESEIKRGAIGIGIGYFAARQVGRRRAEVEMGDRETAGIKFGKTEVSATKIGAGVAIAGAMGLLGDDEYDDAAYAAGLSVMAADQALDAREQRLQEPPSE